MADTGDELKGLVVESLGHLGVLSSIKVRAISGNYLFISTWLATDIDVTITPHSQPFMSVLATTPLTVPTPAPLHAQPHTCTQAQIRASIHRAVNTADFDPINGPFPPRTQLQRRLLESPMDELVLSLIKDFCDAYELDHTWSVLVTEANLANHAFTQRKAIVPQFSFLEPSSASANADDATAAADGNGNEAETFAPSALEEPPVLTQIITAVHGIAMMGLTNGSASAPGSHSPSTTRSVSVTRPNASANTNSNTNANSSANADNAAAVASGSAHDEPDASAATVDDAELAAAVAGVTARDDDHSGAAVVAASAASFPPSRGLLPLAKPAAAGSSGSEAVSEAVAGADAEADAGADAEDDFGAAAGGFVSVGGRRGKNRASRQSSAFGASGRSLLDDDEDDAVAHGEPGAAAAGPESAPAAGKATIDEDIPEDFIDIDINDTHNANDTYSADPAAPKDAESTGNTAAVAVASAWDPTQDPFASPVGTNTSGAGLLDNSGSNGAGNNKLVDTLGMTLTQSIPPQGGRVHTGDGTGDDAGDNGASAGRNAAGESYAATLDYEAFDAAPASHGKAGAGEHNEADEEARDRVSALPLAVAANNNTSATNSAGPSPSNAAAAIGASGANADVSYSEDDTYLGRGANNASALDTSGGNVSYMGLVAASGVGYAEGLQSASATGTVGGSAVFTATITGDGALPAVHGAGQHLDDADDDGLGQANGNCGDTDVDVTKTAATDAAVVDATAAANAGFAATMTNEAVAAHGGAGGLGFTGVVGDSFAYLEDSNAIEAMYANIDNEDNHNNVSSATVNAKNADSEQVSARASAYLAAPGATTNANNTSAADAGVNETYSVDTTIAGGAAAGAAAAKPSAAAAKPLGDDIPEEFEDVDYEFDFNK